MVPESHGFLSTNWNSGEPASKRHTTISEIAKVIKVVQSATQRALPAMEASSPRIAMMNSAPSSGRNVVTERIGQLAISLPPDGNPEPGDEGRNPDQHGKRIVIHVAGLQAYGVARDEQYHCREAIGPKTVDQPAIAAPPQQPAEPQGRPHDEEIIDLVEVPLVEQEAVEHHVLASEFDRDLGTADIEQPRHRKSDHHQHGRQHRYERADVVHVLQDRIAAADGQRLAEEAFDAGAGEDVDERKPGQHAS